MTQPPESIWLLGMALKADDTGLGCVGYMADGWPSESLKVWCRRLPFNEGILWSGFVNNGGIRVETSGWISLDQLVRELEGGVRAVMWRHEYLRIWSKRAPV